MVHFAFIDGSLFEKCTARELFMQIGRLMDANNDLLCVCFYVYVDVLDDDGIDGFKVLDLLLICYIIV